MKVLVTGGAGYIGSVVAHALVQAGHSIVVYDNLSNGHRPAVPVQAKLIVADVGDRVALTQAVRGANFDGVMHFAASIEVGESMLVPEKFFRNNTSNTLTLLEMMLENRIPRLVFSSTAALFGNPDRTPIEESDPPQPTNAYGESKHLVERMLEWFHRIHGLRYASLRYFNAAGAAGEIGEDHQPETHLIPLVLQAAEGKRHSVSIYGTDYPTPDGTCVRDYIHITDLAAAHLLAFERLGRDETPERLIYNLGNGRGFSVLEVIGAAARVAGKDIPVKEAARRRGDPATLVASSQKIRQELGWQPKFTDLDGIIESAWRWRQTHPGGYGQ